MQWRKEAEELARQIDSLRQSAILSQVILPQDEAAIYFRIDALEQQILSLQTKFDASNRPELEAMSNQLAYDFKLLRILSRPPTTPRGVIVKEFKRHPGYVHSMSLSADGSRAVSVDRDGKALVWDTRTGKRITVFSETLAPIHSLAWDEIHGRFYFGLVDGRIIVGE